MHWGGFSNCCCGFFTLRIGTLILSGLMAFSGLMGIPLARDVGILTAIFQLGCGSLGFYASWTKNAKFLRVYLYLLVGVFALQFCVLLLTLMLHEMAVEANTEAACEDQRDIPSKRACEEEVRAFVGGPLFWTWFCASMFGLLCQLWVILIVLSFCEVLEVNGSGDEFKSAETLAEHDAHPPGAAHDKPDAHDKPHPNERTPLSDDAFLTGDP